ncbi:MAG: YajQ family cyclic di-GMP-binding protein [Gammaproteobacteria bacterium CG11_big_fil_rev_8_21_14_0_20_46_22]|nr:MAG: YajQ family cyclic di-GMP-binding protein [Gammaproteobacteria bacterium CG12_big_fil_rev_8_21_14_0_65_46_12]PIR10829.1 MAG: YajQ family cyclic di-GMP-binding protein [Gammaproteobacteria bacterium CG11_big_fil_rev_8_21_14_0_20_46_22]
MPSFDIVSEIDHHELTNAVDQANREVSQRFDFKGTNASFEHTDKEITLKAPSDFQVKQMLDILVGKLIKRGLDGRCYEAGDIHTNLSEAKQVLTLKQGIDRDQAKKLTTLIKDSKLKVQAQIQGEQVRVTGKKRDDLQDVIAMLREAKIDFPVQFDNFRD